MTDPCLEMKAVSFSRERPGTDPYRVLDDTNQTFHPGVTLLTGDTGSGKSTVLHLLSAILRPTSGVVLASGQPVSRYNSFHRDHWRRNVGTLLQSPAFLNNLTALENTMMPLAPRSVAIPDAQQAALDLLGKLRLENYPAHLPGELSGGERQRLALSMALIGSPDYLLMDEPTAHQDQDCCHTVTNILFQKASEGAVVVIATHDPRLVDDPIFKNKLEISAGKLKAL